MKRLRIPGIIMIVMLSVVLASCPDGTGSPGGDEYDSETLSGVFDDIDQDIVTYRDVVLPPLPTLVTDSDDPALDDLKEAYQSVLDFVSTPAGELQFGGPDGALPATLGTLSSSIRPAALLPRATPVPDCLVAGPVSVCTYQWNDDGLVTTLVDSRTPATYQTDWFFKGTGWGVDFPGDLADPDDYGYLIQHHVFTTDCKSGISQSMFVPGLCEECEEHPWAENTFDVTGEMTIATPWGTEHAATYEYSNTVYACEPYQANSMDRWHVSLSTDVECLPNGDVSTDMSAYSYGHHAPYQTAHWFYDDSENSITWDFYDENGAVIGHGTIP